MGVIQVRGPKYDRSYSINIAGNQPTPQEQQRIDRFVQQQELELDQYIQRRTGGPSAEESSIEPVINYYKQLKLLKVVNGEATITKINGEISELIEAI